ncbi:uncharacterized protein LOC142604386 isoform X2 [Balearica regulorum gibbericeps]|uniref:uncharacterized protein LOC142604386 isoform X2 n=1 Tax=Balearica regulorum gibbericeps TaxID=100784 RepID=UPI003F5E13D9
MWPEPRLPESRLLPRERPPASYGSTDRARGALRSLRSHRAARPGLPVALRPALTLTMSVPAKRCGRPPVLSFLEKKKRKQSLDRRRGKTRIYVGNHIDRWLTLKEKLDFRNDAEVAGFLLDLYDSYNPLSKAPICSLPEGVGRIAVKEERALSGSTSLIAADGTYDNDDQLSKESACSELGDVKIVTVKEETELRCDCLATETDDTVISY